MADRAETPAEALCMNSLTRSEINRAACILEGRDDIQGFEIAVAFVDGTTENRKVIKPPKGVEGA